MKRYHLLLVALTFVFFSCSDDDAPSDPYIIHYDGQNNNSPALPTGDYEAAAHFRVSDVQDYLDKNLTAIDYFVYNVPNYGEVRISESFGTNVPGNILRSWDVTSSVIPMSWNRVDLATPFDMSNGMWLSFYFENTQSDLQIMGCDAGPRNLNGDWLYDSQAATQWETYFGRTGESINWNIRGVLEDK